MNTMNERPTPQAIRAALSHAYRILSPFSDAQLWEYDNNLFHLSFLARRLYKHERIVDVGCGIGILVTALRLLGFNATGIDKYIFEPSNSYSVGDIDRLRQIWRDHDIDITPGSATTGLFDGDLFDVVTSVAVIEHQSNLKLFISGLSQYVTPNGRVYIATPNSTNLLNRFRFLFGRSALGNIDEFYTSAGNFTGHWREYTLHELKRIATLAGYAIIRSDTVQTLRPYLTRNWRKWHRLLFRLLAQMIPGSGDTNYLWLQK